MSDQQQLRNFVNGAYVEPADGGYADLIDPCTGEVFARAPVSGAADVDAAMRAAATAFESWRDTTPGERQKALLKLADAVESRAAELVDAEVRNTGKPRQLTAEEELPPAVDQFRFFAGAARLLEGRSAGEYMAGHTSYVRREPIGVCAQVTPWNYPLMMAVWKIAPALAAGNTVVLKPSDTTPVSTLLLAEIAAEFFPPGVFNVVCGDRDTGRTLVSHPTPQLVSITGSTRAGMEVAAAAAPDLKRTHLELGGKAPVVIFDDADIEAVAEAIATGGYFNAGQDCTAATRVLAGPGIHDDFVAALAEQARNTKTGAPDDEDVLYGPLNNANQLARVSGFVDRLPDHADVRTGGSRLGERGYFYAPTVVSGVRQDDEIIRDEVFGPVITVQRFSDEDEAVRWANGVEYGLSASVWTKDHGRAMRMTRRLDFGCVWVNTHIPFVSEMPHGGFKHSGHGKDLSVYSLEDYTRIKHVMHHIEG
ncbi:gamma-aminobutyraldehyde dehydrogenase [Micromonospora endolithica]|uniref:Gamma-aminobutyraldehyde dehydrogenase n=1 Tax=Micromonospora endolithica TaxID=230091 RepID=A0A3A9YPX7_9ACTN|nr:gamma-aminobutyraldehyde dehydrogenase [Micromonospora endolithica]RKN38098.1 gamma-aminobutyraldehyde dehydrogenase [Micromonospora endolithica]TWJ23882.1 betaine-aldehyde dehydrogenase [Micromonospora endolithica]